MIQTQENEFGSWGLGKKEEIQQKFILNQIERQYT